jgi:hypothetical protein
MGRKPQNYFGKLERFKEILLPCISEKTDLEVRRMLRHCWYYKLGRRKELELEERQLFDLLLKHGLSPKTLYEYYLLLDAPQHIRQKLREGKISMRDAQSKSYAYRRLIFRQGGKDIMREVVQIIRRLEWKGHNTTQQV